MSKYLSCIVVFLFGIVATAENLLSVNPYKQELDEVQQIFKECSYEGGPGARVYKLMIVYAQARFDVYQAAANFIEVTRRVGTLQFDQATITEIYNRAAVASMKNFEGCTLVYQRGRICTAVSCPGCVEQAHTFTGYQDLSQSIGKIVGQRAIDNYLDGRA